MPGGAARGASAWYTAGVTRTLTADDVLPIVAALPPEEYGRLLQLLGHLVVDQTVEAYASIPPRPGEFSCGDEDPLEWEASGWENLG